LAVTVAGVASQEAGPLWLPTGASQTFAAAARDEAGRPLAIPPGSVAWACDPAVGVIDSEGRFTAAAAPATGAVTATVLGVSASLRVTVGSIDRPIDDFEVARDWRGSTQPASVSGTVALTEARPHGGARALRLTYDFSAGPATRAIYATADRDLGMLRALRLWVRGERNGPPPGGGAWLRARLRDAGGATHLLDFARSLAASEEWRELRAVVPATAVAPLRLEAIYLVETRPDARGRGEIFLDDLVGEYAPE
jgi:hypothetical protein